MRGIGVVVAVLCSVATALAGPPGDPGTLTVRTVRTPVPPRIDGHLDDEVWQLAPEISGLIQREPDEGAPATMQTFVRILYDDEAIYVAARLDDPESPTLRLGRRDSLLGSTDLFSILLDPHHDHRTAFAFGVSPTNVQIDSAVYNDVEFDFDWDAVWSSAVQIREGGWDVEMAIPLSQLRFPQREEHVWGINILRDHFRLSEDSRLVMVPRSESGWVSRFGHLTGITGIEPKRSVEIVPYGVTRSDLRNATGSGDPYRRSASHRADAGLDLRYPLTQNLMLSAAINPDFGQVEVDPSFINLSDVETFLPEKRLFFVEGSGLFNFGSDRDTFFYSRRIGRQPQGAGRLPGSWSSAPGETTILGAAKLTGKTASGWSIGLLNALTAEEQGRSISGGVEQTRVVEPMTNYLVTRVARDLGLSGSIGGIFTMVRRQNSEGTEFLRDAATVAGVDGQWFVGNRDYALRWFAAVSRIEGSSESMTSAQRTSARYYQRPDASHLTLDREARSLEGWATSIRFAKQTGTWRYHLAGRSHSPGFETNDLGFLSRADYHDTTAGMTWYRPVEWRSLRSRRISATKQYRWNHGGELITDTVSLSGEFQTKDYWMLNFSSGARQRTLDDRQTRGGPLAMRPAGAAVGVWLSTDQRKSVGGELELDYRRDEIGGTIRAFSARGSWRPASGISVSVGPQLRQEHLMSQYVRTVVDPLATATFGSRYVFAILDQKTLSLESRLDWTLTSRLSVQLYMQPFLAVSDYSSFRELARSRSFDYATYGVDRGSIHLQNGRYVVDPDGPGGSSPFSFADPDFSVRSIRGSAILRWEFRPGSALFLVWNPNREAEEEVDSVRPWGDTREAWSGRRDDVVLVKVSFWRG
jgi:hypothetical protein